MKKLISIILTLLMLTAIIALRTRTSSFADVEEKDWYYTPVTVACKKGYITDSKNNEFAPNKAVDKATVISALYIMSGDTKTYKNPFSDIEKNSPYEKAAAWAYDKGIVALNKNSTFKPEKTVSRQELLSIYEKYSQSYETGCEVKTSQGYTDANKIATWAKESVSKMAPYYLLSLREGGALCPEAQVSRAEFYASLLRLEGDYDNGKYDTTVHVSGVYLTKRKLTLEKGAQHTLKAAVLPSNARDTRLKYSISDENIATVSEDGRIDALRNGTADITVTSLDDGYTAICKLTVKTTVEPASGEIDPDKPMIALTFDDGPRPASSNRILDVLEHYNVKATFFELGGLCERYPDVVKRQKELGCETSSHSYDHANLSQLTPQEILDDLKTTENIINDIRGDKQNMLVRPPYGAYDQEVRENSYAPLILWSVDTLDWKSRDPEAIVDVIMSEVTDGSIILMHSIYDTTADAVERVVPMLLEKGYQIVTVSELAHYRGIELESGKSYGALYN